MFCFVTALISTTALALPFNHSFGFFLSLRCVQSIGTSPIPALMNAVIADITTAAERGGYIAYVFAGALLGQPLSLVLGGLVGEIWGWRAVFAVLTAYLILFLTPFALFAPETCRHADREVFQWRLVSTLKRLWQHRSYQAIPPSPILLPNRPVSSSAQDDLSATQPARKERPRRAYLRIPVALTLLTERSALCIVLCTGLLYSGLASMVIGLPFLFHNVHHLNDAQIAFATIPIGIGSCVAVLSSGKLADWNYRRWSHRLKVSMVDPGSDDREDRSERREQPSTVAEKTDVPLEKARLEIAIPLVLVASIGMFIYASILQYKPSSLVPQVTCAAIMACAVDGAFGVLSTLLIDLYRQKAASATAANNLCRSSLAATVTVVTVPIWDAVGIAAMYFGVGIVWIGVLGVMSLIMWKGSAWGRRWN